VGPLPARSINRRISAPACQVYQTKTQAHRLFAQSLWTVRSIFEPHFRRDTIWFLRSFRPPRVSPWKSTWIRSGIPPYPVERSAFAEGASDWDAPCVRTGLPPRKGVFIWAPPFPKRTVLARLRPTRLLTANGTQCHILTHQSPLRKGSPSQLPANRGRPHTWKFARTWDLESGFLGQTPQQS
jgi:hypothetical protein